MALKLAVFDMAGTTVQDNRDVHRALQTALQCFDVAISLDDANEVMGIPKPVAIEKLLLKRYLGKRKIDPTWITQIHQRFVSEMNSFYGTDPAVNEKEGISALFTQLRQAGIKVAVDTGFDRAVTGPLLDRLGWLRNDLIDYSITSDEVPNGRPFPDMIFKLMSLTGVGDAACVAKIGDTPSDLHEGTAAGCRWVIGVTWGAYPREKLLTEPHTHVVDTVPDLLKILHPQ